MQRLEVSGVVRLIYRSLGVKGLNDSTSVVTGSNFSYVCPGIFSCFTVFAVEIKDGAFRFKYVTAPVLKIPAST